MKRHLAKVVVFVYFFSAAFFYNAMAGERAVEVSTAEKGVSTSEKEEGGINISATDLGVMCINTAYPSMEIEYTDSRDNENDYSGEKTETVEDVVVTEEKTVVAEAGEPRVLIVHTHATESYLPSSEGNFHRKDEENTVRDVGNVLEETLEAKGIGVVHDKTLHDYPSYNDSYSRSYGTTQALLQKYPTVECVIDLHRDAMSSTAPAATVSIDGKTCAKYSYVIGTGTATYGSNKAFVNELNGVASSKYSGFTGGVIERGYAYNQGLSSKYLLVEIGFNRNQIEDCRNTAEIFGNILAEALSEG